MGIRSRLKSKVRAAVGNLRAFGAVLNEEANHPGRPQPHMTARNPVWGGTSGAEAPSSSAEPAASSSVSEPAASSSVSEPAASSSAGAPEAETEEVPWYLKYDDNEGWDDPNPGLPKDG